MSYISIIIIRAEVIVKYFSRVEFWPLLAISSLCYLSTRLYRSILTRIWQFIKKYNFFLLKKGYEVSNVMWHCAIRAYFFQKKRKPRDRSNIIENKSGTILKLRSGGRWVNRLLPVITCICPLSGNLASSLIGLYLDLEDVDEVYMKDGSGSCTMQPCTHNSKTSQYQVEARRSDNFHSFYR